MSTNSFRNVAIVSCGTMSLELNKLRKDGFLDTDHILYTGPGLHEDMHELERQLFDKVEKAKKRKDKVIVVYGGKFCYVNVGNPTRTMRVLIDEMGPNVARIDATHCMDMIADQEERDRIQQNLAGGEPVWWMTPGWVKFRKYVFKDWAKATANENFPRHTGGAIVLDAVGYMDQYMANEPEAFLDYCDWMGIPMQAANVSMDRFKGLLLDQLKKLEG
ncbi:MAG: DUF1638 domain-containing protein [Deltaproteobacteria bacterium]|nr:DUF1638 domain-containing protein [Deltaproteobacteria bacterium]